MDETEGPDRARAKNRFQEHSSDAGRISPSSLFLPFPFPLLSEPALPPVSVRLVVDPSGRLLLPPAMPNRWVDGFIARARPSSPVFPSRVRYAVKTGALIAHFSLCCLVGFFCRVFPSENPCYTMPHACTRSPQSIRPPVYGWDSPADIRQ